MSEFDYERETRRGYRDPRVVREYDELASLRGRGMLGVFAREVSRRERQRIALCLDSVFARRGIRTLLDAPCGAGKLAPVFAGRVQRSVAADVSPAMLARARDAFHSAGVSTEFLVADVAALPFAGDSFEAVVCLRLLHRVPSELRRVMLGELARVASRTVIFSLGVLDPLQRFRLALRGRILAGSPVPVSSSRAEASELVSAAGLTMVNARPLLAGLSSEWIFQAEKR